MRIWDVQESGGQIQAMPKAQGEFDFLFDDARCFGCIVDIGDVERCHLLLRLIFMIHTHSNNSIYYKYTVNHENASPVLDCAFSADGSTVFSVGADKAVRMWNLGTSAATASCPISPLKL